MLRSAAIRRAVTRAAARPAVVRPIVGVIGALFIGFGIPVIPAAEAG